MEEEQEGKRRGEERRREALVDCDVYPIALAPYGGEKSFS